MHFKVTFSSDSLQRRSFMLLFIPNPCWVLPDPQEGSNKYIILAKVNLSPYYEVGGVSRLGGRVRGIVPASETSRAEVTVFQDGHGQQRDLDYLIADLEAVGYRVTVTRE